MQSTQKVRTLFFLRFFVCKKITRNWARRLRITVEAVSMAFTGWPLRRKLRIINKSLVVSANDSAALSKGRIQRCIEALIVAIQYGSVASVRVGEAETSVVAVDDDDGC
jgi:hypothetical protein